MQQGCDMDQRFYIRLYRNNTHNSLAILLTSMFISSTYHTQKNRIVNKIEFLKSDPFYSLYCFFKLAQNIPILLQIPQF